jgi:hypothetical protein
MVFLRRFWRSGALYLFLAGLLYLYIAVAPGIGVYDWQKELAYFAQIKDALGNLPHLPFYWWGVPDSISWYPAVAHSHIFVGNPETWLFSPLAFLLLTMKVTTFAKILPLIFFLIGLTGAFKLRRLLDWTDAQWRLFGLVFFFNPLFIQHFAIGYTPWLNLFLLPWLVYFLLTPKRFERYLGLPATLAIGLLQGGSHVFVWFSFVVGLYYAFKAGQERSWRVVREGLLIMSGAALLGWARLFTTLVGYGSFAQSALPGYSIGNWLFWSTVPPVGLNYAAPNNLFLATVMDDIPSWDAGLYLGALPLLVIGLLWLMRRRYSIWSQRQQPDMSRLVGVALVLGLLSFSYLWTTITFVFGLDLLMSAEKYSFRLLIPALLVMAIPLAGAADALWGAVTDWATQHRPRFRWLQSIFWLEMIVLLPLLWANIFWVRLATIDRSVHDQPTVHAPVTKPKLDVNYSGRLLTIKDVPETGVIIPDLLIKDVRLFDQYNVKALSSTGAGIFVLPERAGEIGFVFRSSQFKTAILLTGIFWSIWLGCLIAGLARRRRNRRL